MILHIKMQFHHAGRQFFFITIAIERPSNLAPQGFGGAVPVRFSGGASRLGEPRGEKDIALG